MSLGDNMKLFFKKLIPEPLRLILLRFDFIRKFTYKLQKKHVISIPIKWLDEYNKKVLLKQKESSRQTSPDYGKGSQTLLNESPDVFLYQFENAIVSVNSSSVLTNDLLYIERFQGINQKKARYVSGHLKWHSLNKADYEINNKQEIKQNVLFLGGNGSFNYFHWLIELVPKLLLLNNDIINKYNIEAIVVNEIVSKNNNFKTILNVLNAKINLPIIYLNESRTYSIHKVFYITTFNNALYNSTNNYSDISFFYFSTILINQFIKTLKNNLGQIKADNSEKYPNKIFLWRGKVNSFNKRDYNQDETFQFFKKYGFQKIKPEEYSFFEQIKLFENATHIIGPSGAFWANVIFCKKNTKCLSWLDKKFENFSVYSTLANIINAKMRFVLTNNNSKELHGPYTVKLKKFEGISEYYI